MPEETQDAVDWALSQTWVEGEEPEVQSRPITRDTPHELVHMVGEYFNAQGVTYGTFEFADLEPYLPQPE